MRWKIKPKAKEIKPIVIKHPEGGDRKEVTQFALFPTKIDNENVVWLEKYFDCYVYRTYKKYKTGSDRFEALALGKEDSSIVSEWVFTKRKHYV